MIGIVKKNAIMMIDFALEAERKEGKSPLDAVREACLLRFRPIMMTTMAALFGGLPLALGRGIGSEFRRPLGIAIVGGLILSQLLTLFTTPVTYLYLDRLRWRARKRRGAAPSKCCSIPPMIKNGSDIANGTALSTRVCVIGSGPAGVTAALELHRAGIEVILIEGSRIYSSVESSWPDKKLLYNGEALGLFAQNEPEFLILPYVRHGPNGSERERTYGGTSTHWGGQTRPEDPIDLEARPGFPGWPVTREELDPYYARATQLCLLHGDFNGGENYSNEYWAKELQADVPVVDGFDVEMYQFIGGDYLDFATRTFDDGKPIGDLVDVIRNATLLDIEHQGGRVRRLHVASMDTSNPPQKATEFTIEADAYILACGAVANARQLLVSDIGNEHDNVGRYFLAHALSNPGAVNMLTDYLTESQGRYMNGDTPSGTWTDANGVVVNARFIPSAATVKEHGIGRCWFWHGWTQYYFETAPNPDSRVTLADSLDPVFGQRQTRIDWQLTPTDQKTYETATALFIQSVQNLGGEVSCIPWEWLESQLIVNGHHMGTTRMSETPEDGVVDKNLRVHSMENLYVAGSSVFSSGGISNPTFTIITLSIRLADHLRQQMAGRRRIEGRPRSQT